MVKYDTYYGMEEISFPWFILFNRSGSSNNSISRNTIDKYIFNYIFLLLKQLLMIALIIVDQLYFSYIRYFFAHWTYNLLNCLCYQYVLNMTTAGLLEILSIFRSISFKHRDARLVKITVYVFAVIEITLFLIPKKICILF